MKLEKCPVCSTKMRESGGRMVCPECGYYQILTPDIPQQSKPQPTYQNPAQGQASAPPTYQNPAPQQIPTQPLYQNDAQGQNPAQPTYQNPAPQRITVTTVRDKNKNTAACVIGATASGIILFSALIALLSVTSINSSSDKTAEETVTEENNDSYGAVSGSDNAVTTDHPEFITQLRDKPLSAGFQAIVSQVFGKRFDEVDPAELSQVTGLYFYYDEEDLRECIDCVLADQTTYQYYWNQNLELDFADITCFPNLTSLCAEYGNLRPGDLYPLMQLRDIASDLTLEELAGGLADPGRIETIKTSSSSMESLDALGAFPNLRSLSADCVNLTDIGALSGTPGLTQLSLTSCDDLSDYTALYDLPYLQSLSIQSEGLKDIGFIGSMPQLSDLTLKDASLSSIDALTSCAASLEKLSLEDTSILGYQVLENLTGLTELAISADYDTPLPSLAGCERLESLKIQGSGNPAPAVNAKNLKRLILDSCNCEDLSFLDGLQDLEELRLHYILGNRLAAEPILRLPKLTLLDISNNTLYTDTAPLLTIPTLEEFYMEDCTAEFKAENLSLHENLAVLDLNRTVLCHYSNMQEYDGWLGYDMEELPLSEHTDLFENFPNLTCLYLAGTDLDDLSFVTEYGLNGLEILDIRDNYIVSLSPLSSLPSLRLVRCVGNPLTDTAGLDGILER